MKKVQRGTPTPEQLAAVRQFRDKYGRGWREGLLNAWMNGRDASEPDGHLLRQVRNQFGPTWLGRVQNKELE